MKTTPMTHREVLQSMSGLMLGMLVSILAGTVVSTSLPVIVADLGGTQASYTWVVTATLLATTISTPIWGKFADAFNRKLLLQSSLVIFVLASALGGIATSTSELIVFRVLQGLGAGGLTALSQVVIADIISPRERGRYMGLLGGVMAVGTVGGPLLGGFLTDHLGWRSNFFVGVPIALVALIVLQKTLHLTPPERQKLRIDYWGAALLSGGVSLLLIWVTMGGQQFEWSSPISMIMLGGALILIAATITVELKVKDPMLPLHLLKNKTVSAAVIASVAVGVVMFGATVFLGQYFQLARGKTPTESGLLTLPMIAGLLISSIVVGQLISRYGKWKAFMVTGGALLSIGLGLLGTLRADTSWALIDIYLFILGLGVGMVMQNLVLVVQNVINPKEMGSGTSAVAFFRSLGGTVGVSSLGALLAARITTLLSQGLGEMGATGDGAGTKIPNLSELPEPIRAVVESAYGEGVGNVFLAAAPLALVALIAIIMIPNTPLSNKTAAERVKEITEEEVVLA